MLSFLKVIFHLIVEKLDVVIQFSSLDCPSVVTQSTHLSRKRIDSFCFYTYFSVIGVSLYIDYSIENMRIDNSVSDQINSLNVRTVMSDCFSKKLPFLLFRIKHCILHGLTVLAGCHCCHDCHKRHC